ncbi:hypothetical protein V6N13_099647 [Hibiscus sabdariffa]
MRLAGSAFLLMFMNKERLDKAKSEYKESLHSLFKKLSLWSEDVVACNRQIWIACQGIPVHAWSEETFKNIASIWGELISVDENTIKPTSFSRANIHILTNNFDRLNEEILFSVDSKSYRVRIFEFEPSIKPILLWYEGGASSDDVKSRGSSSESSEAMLKSGVNVHSATGLGRWKVDFSLLSLSEPAVVQVGVVNSERAGDSVPEGDAPRDLSLEPSNMSAICVDVVNVVGTSPAGTIMYNDENPKELRVDRAALISARKIDLGVKIGETHLSPKLMNRHVFPYVTSNDVDEEFSSNHYSLDQALEDVSGMGLGKQETWAEKANRANSASTLFPEMQDLYRKSTRKYRSLLELQDNALSVKEKKRRDHAIERNKRLEKEKTSLEVEATSPTNSDIARKKILTRSTRNTLALGKHYGIEFIDDENEILKDFVAAEMQEK